MAQYLLISGCSTGIGRACALHFARTGYHVFACVRKTADAESLQAEDVSGNLEPVMLDVTNKDQLEALRATLTERIGDVGLAGLVNNAGIARNGPIEFVDPQKVRDVFEVNVMGPILLTQAFLPLVRQAKGRIVTIGSIAGKVAFPTMAPYCISKYSVEAFNDSLRRELAPQGIHVSLVEPGPIATPMLHSADDMTTEAFETLPPEGEALYGELIRKTNRIFNDMDTRSLQPQAVADVVEHALQSPKPKTRYLVTRDAKANNFLAWLLPDKVFDGFSNMMTKKFND